LERLDGRRLISQPVRRDSSAANSNRELRERVCDRFGRKAGVAVGRFDRDRGPAAGLVGVLDERRRIAVGVEGVQRVRGFVVDRGGPFVEADVAEAALDLEGEFEALQAAGAGRVELGALQNRGCSPAKDWSMCSVLAATASVTSGGIAVVSSGIGRSGAAPAGSSVAPRWSAAWWRLASSDSLQGRATVR